MRQEQQIRYVPAPTAEVTARVTNASQNFASGGCPVYLGSKRVDCTLAEIDAELGASLMAALERIAARKLKGRVEAVPAVEPEPE